jgi:plastocyanin
MARALSTLIICFVVVLVAGCGSSSNSTVASTPSGASLSTGATERVTTTGGLKVVHIKKFASPPASAPVQSGTVNVLYHNITIQPDTLKVKVGTTVKWTNLDSVEHNVTSESGPETFSSGTFGEGRSFRVTFTKPGVVHYECTIHPTSMNGTIEVVS